MHAGTIAIHLWIMWLMQFCCGIDFFGFGQGFPCRYHMDAGLPIGAGFLVNLFLFVGLLVMAIMSTWWKLRGERFVRERKAAEMYMLMQYELEEFVMNIDRQDGGYDGDYGSSDDSDVDEYGYGAKTRRAEGKDYDPMSGMHPDHLGAEAGFLEDPTMQHVGPAGSMGMAAAGAVDADGMFTAGESGVGAGWGNDTSHGFQTGDGYGAEWGGGSVDGFDLGGDGGNMYAAYAGDNVGYTFDGAAGGGGEYDW